jgi:hypothetical protein
MPGRQEGGIEEGFDPILAAIDTAARKVFGQYQPYRKIVEFRRELARQLGLDLDRQSAVNE